MATGGRMSNETTPETGAAIGNYYYEGRTFPPAAEFAENALLSDPAIYDAAAADPVAFWAERAREMVTWFEDFHTPLEWELPFAKWFVGGKLNVSYNCLDRHVEAGKGDKVAFYWEGEPGDTRTITYTELLADVCRFANVLAELGVTDQDRVCIYMPMIPETVVAMLACTRIGAAHSVVFGGFSPDSLIDRINDAGAAVVVTADAGYRRGQPSALKVNVDAALGDCPTVRSVVVVDRCGIDVEMVAGRDHWWHNLMGEASPHREPAALDSEHLLYLLYTSGTTAKPKGIMHTTGGYLTQVAWTHKMVFDLQPDTDVYWCGADIGWVTGHSYIVYGPLANGATSVMYEGTPDTPREELRDGTDPAGWSKDRLWDIIERYGVTQMYTAPTAIRTFMKWGAQEVQRHDLSSLRLLGTVGEPINPEAWMWYHENIGGGRCPIVDTWWQTETGSIMISPLPGATPTTPGSATRPLPGIVPEILDKEGNEVPKGSGGFLVISKPWPSMLRNLYGDPERYKEAYWSQIPGKYFTGDGARQDADGNFWILGRVDDVLNVSGHRLSTMEVESALVGHPLVAEAAVVGRPDEIKGEGIVAFVSLSTGQIASDALKKELMAHVVKEIGALARPDEIKFTDSLPKTRSGKIMRRLLRDIAAGRASTGDTSTLEDFSVLAKLRADDES